MEHKNETLMPDGTVIVEIVPWSRADYLSKIQDIEELITPRRIREANLTSGGREWLSERDEEIQALRIKLEELESGNG